MRILRCFFLLVLLCASAFAQQNRTTIKNGIQSNFATGKAGGIGATELRATLTAIVDSVPNFVDDGAPITAVNVKKYGARGNGTADDSTAIAAAFAAAPSGSTVFFPAGTYILSEGVTISTANTKILGFGATLKSSSSSLATLLTVTASRVQINGLTLDGSFTTGSVAPGSWVGLIQITGATSTAVSQVQVAGCSIKNAAAVGIRVLGNVDGARILENDFVNNFINIYAEPDTRTWKNLSIRGNRHGATWMTGTYSGCIKVKGNGGSSLYPTGLTISDEVIVSDAEMGIELFDSIKDSSVENCKVDGTKFGISLDAAENVTVALNKITRNSYCGIETADACHDCLIKGNTVDEYSSGTTRGGSKGIVATGPSSYRNTIEGNTVRGVAGPCIDLQENNHIFVRGNRLFDSTILLNFKNSSYMVAQSNDLYGPCNYHIFIDANDWNITDTQIVGNTIIGAAAFDNIIIYSGVSGRVVTNVSIIDNDAMSSTYVNLPINISGTNLSTPNRQVYGNRYVAANGTTELQDYATTPEKVLPYRLPIQHAGLNVSAKRVITAEPSGSARWIKIVDGNYGNPFFLQLHVFGYTTTDAPVKCAFTAIITGAPYGFDSGIALLPSAQYYGPVVSDVIYNNPSSGAAQEVWLKIPATADPLTLECYFSDYPDRIVLAPTWTTTEPTWATNHYNAAITTNPKTLRIPGLVSSGPVTVGGGSSLLKIVSATGFPSFGDIAANSDGTATLTVSGAVASGTPSVSLGWDSGLPAGIVLTQAWVSASDTVSIRLRNTTGGTVTVGTPGCRAQVTQF